MQPDKLRQWHMWQRMSWVQLPTQSGPHAQRPRKGSVTRQVAWNVNGNVHNFRAKSGISCLTTRSCATKSAGSYSIADPLACTTTTTLVSNVWYCHLEYKVKTKSKVFCKICPTQRSQNGTQKSPEMHLFLGNRHFCTSFVEPARRSVVENDRPPLLRGAPDPSTRLSRRFAVGITLALPQGKCRIEQSGTAGGTAARRDGVRVFAEFSWLEVGSVTVVLSRPTRWLSW
jgi:hypothetical protein